MMNTTSSVEVPQRVSTVASEFVRMYYKVMNTYPAYLHLFYERDSTVVVSESQEDDSTLSVKAATEDEIKKLLAVVYDDVSVRLFTCVPQTSLKGCILLLNSGRIKRKNYDKEKFFTQVLVLGRQEKGYYVRNDTLQVMSVTGSIQFDLLPLPTSKEAKNDTRRRLTERTIGMTKHQPHDSVQDHHIELRISDQKNRESSSHDEMAAMNIREDENFKKAHNSLPDDSIGSFPLTVDCQSHTHGKANNASVSSCTYMMSSPTIMTPLGLSGDGPSTGRCQRTFNNMEIPSPHVKALELTSLFAARLPLDITPQDVNALFSAHGRLQKTAPIRVFTGLTNCYACVNFESETEMRKALEAEIVYDGSVVVTEIWRPRDRRGRRSGREFQARRDTTGATAPTTISSIQAGY